MQRLSALLKQYDELLDAGSMIPGFFVAWQFLDTIPVPAFMYMLMCVCSIVYHCFNHFHGYMLELFKVDVSSQIAFAISVACHRTVFDNIPWLRNAFIGMLCVYFYTVAFRKNTERQLVIAIGGLNIFLTSIKFWMHWVVTFSFFIISERFLIPHVDSIFHILCHIGIYKTLKWIQES